MVDTRVYVHSIVAGKPFLFFLSILSSSSFLQLYFLLEQIILSSLSLSSFKKDSIVGNKNYTSIILHPIFL